MLVKQILLKDSLAKRFDKIPFEADLILLFVSRKSEDLSFLISRLRDAQPDAIIAGCSTPGAVHRVRVYDRTIALTAIKFEKTKVVKKAVHFSDIKQSFEAGKTLASEFKPKGLRHLLVFSDGLNANADEFLRGLSYKLEGGVSITGGLAGDVHDSNETFVINQNAGVKNTITAVGLYSKNLQVCCSTSHGWRPFGKNRIVTKAEDNILYELDGEPALPLIRSFLGKNVDNLLESALQFPIGIEKYEDDSFLVRSIIGIDEGKDSLIFAGNIPEGSVVRLLKARFDDLVDSAKKSARRSKELSKGKPDLAIVVSGVGRRMVLKQMADVEIETIEKVIGSKSAITGFYGYGEFMTSYRGGPCQLYNQSLTITTFKEN